MITLGKQYFKMFCPKCQAGLELEGLEIDRSKCMYRLYAHCIACDQPVTHDLDLTDFIELERDMTGGGDEQTKG